MGYLKFQVEKIIYKTIINILSISLHNCCYLCQLDRQKNLSQVRGLVRKFPKPLTIAAK